MLEIKAESKRGRLKRTSSDGFGPGGSWRPNRKTRNSKGGPINLTTCQSNTTHPTNTDTMKVYPSMLLLLASSTVGTPRPSKSDKLTIHSSMSSDFTRPYHVFHSSKSSKTKSGKSQSNELALSLDRSPCADPKVPPFVIDGNQDIGDVLLHGGPGFVAECGPDCYTVKDNGDDPPYDPELGDTLRFAYKKISRNHFSIRSRVCGVKCDGEEDAGMQLYFGRVGLMVRETLDPFARNVFVSHSPQGQADWSFRTEPGGGSIVEFDGSPDVECLWITLARDGDEFIGSYAYEGNDMCSVSEYEIALHLHFKVDMPETVFLGLAVSTAVSPPYCAHTEADFKDIECRGC
ncbi:hypothetical protein ACHAXT_007574 [Thalassiosira profunda]